MLVIGSGASGPARRPSPPSAPGARVALATKGSIQANNSVEGAGRDPGRRSATTTRPSCTPRTSCARRTRPPILRLVEILTAEAPWRDPLARGARLRVHARERRLPARALRRRVAQAAAPGRRPHRPRDHEGAARGCTRPAARTSFQNHARSARSSRTERRLARRSPQDGDVATIDAGTVVLAAGGRCYAEAERASTSSRRTIPNATGEVTRIALDLRRRGARPRRAPVPPERRRLAGDDAGLLDPGDDARVRRRAPERRRRGVHRLARPARRRLAGDLRRGRGRAAASRREDGRPAVYLDTTRISEADADVSLPYMLRRYRGGGHRPARGADPHLPCPPLPERRPRDRRRRRDHARGCSTPAARSPAARTGATA